MLFKMKFYVDGACRGNGRINPIAVAACCLMEKGHNHLPRTQKLPQHPTPTNQRAEFTALILALQWALERSTQLSRDTRMKVLVYSDSKYAVKSMNTWIHTWSTNGWVKMSTKKEVANRDLLQIALGLSRKIEALGSLTYKWISRSKNKVADRYCNEALDA
ncbi:ribonuclease H1 [Xylaria nigripes]|nr:ribonuclease H1 [Xylaria nigripes]